MQDKNSEIISDELIDLLSDYFHKKVDDFILIEKTDTPYIMFRMEFLMYNYFNVILNYDRGRFGCSIINGSRFIPLRSSQKWYDTADMDVFIKELELQIELRIPDKYLEFNGWK